MKRLEKKLRNKWKPVLRTEGRISDKQVEAFKKDVELVLMDDKKTVN